MPKSKLTTLDEFKALLKDGMTIMVGGFMTDGTPEQLINAVVESGVKNLTLINNDGGYPERGIGKLIANGQVKKLIASHVGLNPTVAKLMNSGEMEVDLVPQGTLAERIRAKGAGLGGILTQTGLGTLVQEGKQVIESEGKKYLLEVPLAADLAIIEATYADKFGNGVNIGTTRNFNPLMALAADKVVLGTYKLHELGEVDPSTVTIYGVLVDHIVQIEEM
ncbi:MAG TPA: 3-oxoacid CoA-transferase subunit A [Burkholderiales bacterium]|jgi:acetate CoA/acetoacetate CoA-transferase alpha subunit|nr:3-oxoacid CoA-transferase subunit A [Burkholderiales bacterium]